MNCKICGYLLPSEATKFCPRCGAKVKHEASTSTSKSYTDYVKKYITIEPVSVTEEHSEKQNTYSEVFNATKTTTTTNSSSSTKPTQTSSYSTNMYSVNSKPTQSTTNATTNTNYNSHNVITTNEPKTRAYNNMPSYNPSEDIKYKCSKKSFGMLMFLFSFFGLCVGLFMFPKDTQARSSFVGGWFTSLGILIAIVCFILAGQV